MKDEKVVDSVDFRTKKQKIADFWSGVGTGIKATGEWIIEHPVQTALIAGSVAGVIKESRLAINKGIELHDARVSERTIYANDIQQNVELKHKLTTIEAVELRERMNNGQTKLQALIDMNLIKR